MFFSILSVQLKQRERIRELIHLTFDDYWWLTKKIKNSVLTINRIPPQAITRSRELHTYRNLILQEISLLTWLKDSSKTRTINSEQ